MRFNPIHNRDVNDFQVTSDLTKSCTIGIHFDGLSPHCIAMHLPWGRGIATLIYLAAPTLAPRPWFTGFDLIFRIVTVWTFAHPPNLFHIQNFPASQRQLRGGKDKINL